MNELRIISLKKSFNGKSVLDINDFVFSPGIHCLKGKNGTGKTTLFNCLAGISPFKGKVSLGDESVESVGYKLSVNYSQSTPKFPEFLHGKDMIHLFMRLKKGYESQKVDLVERFDFSDYLDAPIDTFSSGTLKKMSLIIAFLGNPDWIILDEPFITLDSESQKVLSALIHERFMQGTSFLYATHQDINTDLVDFSSIYELKAGGLKKGL